MVFWMKSAARTISGELKGKLDRALDLGPLAVALVAFLGVGREGLETAIFFYATAAGRRRRATTCRCSAGSSASPAPCCSAGSSTAGALRINLGRFFRGPASR